MLMVKRFYFVRPNCKSAIAFLGKCNIIPTVGTLELLNTEVAEGLTNFVFVVNHSVEKL